MTTKATIWGKRYERTCPSGEVVKLKVFSMMNLLEKGSIGLGFIADVSVADSAPATEEAKVKHLVFQRAVIEAGVAEPKIGEDGIPFDEIPDRDRQYLFTEITGLLRDVGGLSAVMSDESFPNGGRSKAD